MSIQLYHSKIATSCIQGSGLPSPILLYLPPNSFRPSMPEGVVLGYGVDCGHFIASGNDGHPAQEQVTALHCGMIEYAPTPLFKLVRKAYQLQEGIKPLSSTEEFSRKLPFHVESISTRNQYVESDLKAFAYLDERRKREIQQFEDYTKTIEEICDIITVAGCELIKNNYGILRVGPEFISRYNPCQYIISFDVMQRMEIEERNYNKENPVDYTVNYPREDD